MKRELLEWIFNLRSSVTTFPDETQNKQITSEVHCQACFMTVEAAKVVYVYSLSFFT